MGFITDLIKQETTVKALTDSSEAESIKAKRMILEKFAQPIIDAINEVQSGEFYFSSEAHFGENSSVRKIMNEPIKGLFSLSAFASDLKPFFFLNTVGYGFNVSMPRVTFLLENDVPILNFETGFGKETKVCHSYEEFAVVFSKFIVKYKKEVTASNLLR